MKDGSKNSVLFSIPPRGNTPISSEKWVRQTIEVFVYLKALKASVICSNDPFIWNMSLYLAGRAGLHIKLLINENPEKSGETELKRIINDYNLNEKLTEPIYFQSGERDVKKIWQVRDALAVKEAGVIIPVSIRDKGRLYSILSEIGLQNKIDDRFRIPREKPKSLPIYDFTEKHINNPPENEWLIHWTRASQGLWPDERPADFFRDFFKHPDAYVRDAKETLIRILATGFIRGASSFSRAGEPYVSFTGLSPEYACSLMKWRRRFVRYNFEPFGIGIRKSAFIERGGRKVIYREKLPEGDDRVFFHSPGKITDWTQEKEWRFRGNIDIKGLAPEDLLVIVQDEINGERDFRASWQRLQSPHSFRG